MKKNKINYLIGIFLIGFGISSSSYALTVGVTAGPHAQIMEKVKMELHQQGLELKIVEFNDFILPNLALNQKDLDLNSYQTPQFLEDQISARGYKLANLGKTILLPLGIYSSKHKSMDSLPIGAKISIPNDPSNEGRALLLLKKAGLIDLKNHDHPSVLDIIENKKKLKIVELEAPQLPRSLADVDYAVINTDWVLVAKIDPRSAVFREGIESPYANILVIRKGDESRSDIQKFKAVYQSEKIRKYILKEFKGAVLPAWLSSKL
jgi:D-methionine transport system substrate-binding protein